MRLPRIVIVALLVASAAIAHAVEAPIFSDGLEVGSVCNWSAAQPDPACPPYQTCSQASGAYWGCFEVPYLGTPSPTSIADSGGPVGAGRVDVYLLVDRSASMASEIASFKANLATVVANVQCSPQGSGTPPDCYDDLWVGAGGIGYTGTSGQSYVNFADVQTNASVVAAAISSTEPAGCCNETAFLATWAAATGQGSATSGCTLSNSFSARASCSGSAADLAGDTAFGYPCLRSDALPLLLIATDEAPSVTFNCPTLATTAAAVNAVGGRIIGLYGSGSDQATINDLTALATQTGAVDAQNADAPLVFSASGAGAAAAMQTALLTARAGVDLADVWAQVVDDGGDAVDVATLVDYVEVAPDADVSCATTLTTDDRDADGHDDTYVSVPPDSVLCWRVVPLSNSSLPGAAVAQNYAGTLRVRTGGARLQDLPLLFIVPPG